jgi:hypothetical protein
MRQLDTGKVKSQYAVPDGLWKRWLGTGFRGRGESGFCGKYRNTRHQDAAPRTTRG